MMILPHTLAALRRKQEEAPDTLPRAAFWLVWEPGKWVAPPKDEDETNKVELAVALRTEVGEPLCYALEDPGAGQAAVVGRHRQCDLIINDGTVSRRHARLVRTADGWELVAMEGAKKTRVAGRSLEPGESTALGSGDDVRLGGARLTFLERKALIDRIGGRGSKRD